MRARDHLPSSRLTCCLAIAALAALLCLGELGAGARAAGGSPTTITNYTDPGQAMKWGYRSHWKQPWRSYLDTVPATALLDAVGINFNVPVKWAEPTARMLANSGFSRARIEVGWNNIDFEDPGQMNPNHRASLVAYLTAMKDHGIRPLILLNANSGGPCPVKEDTVELTQPAKVGATELHIAPSDVAKVTRGRTGIRSGGTAANYIFKSVSQNGTVELSWPLGKTWASKKSLPTVGNLPAGPLAVETLLYEPFRPATREDGSPNPAFERTMGGWLNYVGVVTREAKAILGSEDFDVEVWNELSFGSRFLNINGYYDPPTEWRATGSINEILERTVAYLRDPAHGVASIGIGNGFSNQAPYWNGSESPPGLTAIDKHPYHGWESFPAKAQVNGNRPLNGLGEPAGTKDASNQWHESFTPTYDSFFPEYFLSGIQTETLARDLSPTPSMFGGAEHGRFTRPAQSAAPAMWITEVNLDPTDGPPPADQMTAADVRHGETKGVLRYLTAYVNKGVTALDFYAARAGNLSLVDPRFFNALGKKGSTYPGDALGGETTDALRRYTDSMRGAVPLATPRQLSLRELTDYSNGVQFQGNGTAAYPPLFDRDVFGFFPFQVDPHRFVIPVYVMTRNLSKLYRPGADSTDPSRFDLPPETYRMAIGNIDGTGAEATATDPLTGESVPVEIVSGSAHEVVVEMGVTDSPRLLTIQEAGDAGAAEEESSTEEPGEEPPAGGEEPEVEPPAEEESEAEEPEGEEETGEEVPDPEAPVEEEAAEHEGEGEGSPAATELPELVTETLPSMRLRGGHALLERRRLGVVASCALHCTVSVSGRLTIGRRTFAMTTARAATASAKSGDPTSVELAISARLAGLGRLAVQRGSAVKATVTVVARSGSGALQTARRVVLFGH